MQTTEVFVHNHPPGGLSNAQDATTTLSATLFLSNTVNFYTNTLGGDQFGYSLGSGDLDADGATDLIIGSRTHHVTDHASHFDDASAAYRLYGAGPRKMVVPVIVR